MGSVIAGSLKNAYFGRNDVRVSVRVVVTEADLSVYVKIACLITKSGVEGEEGDKIFNVGKTDLRNRRHYGESFVLPVETGIDNADDSARTVELGVVRVNARFGKERSYAHRNVGSSVLRIHRKSLDDIEFLKTSDVTISRAYRDCGRKSRISVLVFEFDSEAGNGIFEFVLNSRDFAENLDASVGRRISRDGLSGTVVEILFVKADAAEIHDNRNYVVIGNPHFGSLRVDRHKLCR